MEDLESWESQYGPIPDGSLVLLYSGWDSYYDDKDKFLGTDGEMATWNSSYTNMHFPGIVCLFVCLFILYNMPVEFF